jgi:tetratricopeptide (TPR) repeat protein
MRGVASRRGTPPHPPLRGTLSPRAGRGGTWWAFFVAVILAAPLFAHDGVHEQLERASKRIAAEPKNAALYLHRGELYRLHRDFDLARADYARAAKLEPSLEMLDFARGRMELEAGRLDVARTALDRFLARNPEHAEARLTRARTLVRLDRAADAIADYDAAVKHAPEPAPDLYHERAKVLAALDRIDEALRGLDEGMSRLGKLVSLQRLAIDVALAAGRVHDALERSRSLPDNRETRALLERINALLPNTR